jgi:hypothetical protein
MQRNTKINRIRLIPSEGSITHAEQEMTTSKYTSQKQDAEKNGSSPEENVGSPVVFRRAQ